MTAVPEAAVRFYFVWTPVLPADDLPAASALATAETDVRVIHFWDPDRALAFAWATTLGVEDAPGAWWGSSVKRPIAWDVITLFVRGARWGAAPAPPKPAHWAFPDTFDADTFRAQVVAALAAPPPHG